MHGAGSCTTRTFPTRCRRCGGAVFFFSCSCGSKVFFDQLGLPWPEHDCEGSAGHSGTTFGLDPATASRIVRAFAERTGWAVPALAWEPERLAPHPPRPAPIARVEPTARATRRVVGIVREVLAAAPTADRLDVRPGSLLDAQVRRKLPPVTFQLTVHEGALEDHQLRSFTFLIAPALLAGGAPRAGDLVEVALRGVVIPGIASVWEAGHLAPVA